MRKVSIFTLSNHDNRQINLLGHWLGQIWKNETVSKNPGRHHDDVTDTWWALMSVSHRLSQSTDAPGTLSFLFLSYFCKSINNIVLVWIYNIVNFLRTLFKYIIGFFYAKLSSSFLIDFFWNIEIFQWNEYNELCFENGLWWLNRWCSFFGVLSDFWKLLYWILICVKCASLL